MNGVSQKIEWKADVNSFFDNTEFLTSKVKIHQTMAGTHIAPQIGLSVDSVHKVFVGADVMREFGSDELIDYTDALCYYEFDKKPFTFYMGAFPRKYAVSDFPRIFFQDSISNYRPVMNGIFWQIYNETNYVNVWLDWTSRQTETRHETLMVGGSGRYNYGDFFLQAYGYYFHYARLLHPVEFQPLVDNALMLASIGYSKEETKYGPYLDIRLGWTLGLERERLDNIKHTPGGLLSELRIGYRGVSIFNTLYKGTGQMIFIEKYANKLYWGDQVYQLGFYDRLDANLNFISNAFVNLNLTYSLHFCEGKVYHEQILKAGFNLESNQKKKCLNQKFIWDSWLNR
jgi:hypothetical protein